MKTSFKVLFFACAVALISCSPISKDGYIKQYADFIAEVEAGYSNFTDADWVARDEQFTKFSKELYVKFLPKMTPSEKSALTDYEYKYTYCRTLSKGKSAWGSIKDAFHREMDKMKQDVADELKVGAEGVTDAINSAVDDIANEIKKLTSPEEGESQESNSQNEFDYR